jgi:hypothetical protein
MRTGDLQPDCDETLTILHGELKPIAPLIPPCGSLCWYVSTRGVDELTMLMEAAGYERSSAASNRLFRKRAPSAELVDADFNRSLRLPTVDEIVQVSDLSMPIEGRNDRVFSNDLRMLR